MSVSSHDASIPSEGRPPHHAGSAEAGFDGFGLGPSLLRAVREAGFEDPRPIQSATIPAALDGRDVLGLAATGTGKTAAFALPILERLLRDRRSGTRVLVLAPTRELANQIATEMEALARFTKLSVTTVFGGVSQRRQEVALRRRPEIVVGCPGRVLDLIQQNVFRTGDIETLVLDEADHMFDLGFLPSIRRIIAALPGQRQNLLFSATMPPDMRRLADEILRDPEVVELARRTPAGTIDHALYLVAEQRKRDLLDRVLERADCTSAIVFTRTKFRARRLAEQLSKAGRRAIALQGNMSQSARDRAMGGFRRGRFDVLVATDIAARGIDVSAVSHVINFDVPDTPDAYTHRIGRTGRSERDGIAYTFVTGGDHGWLRATERRIGRAIPRVEVEGFDHETDRAAAPGPTGAGARDGAPSRRRPRNPRQRGSQNGARGANRSSGGGAPAAGRKRSRRAR